MKYISPALIQRLRELAEFTSKQFPYDQSIYDATESLTEILNAYEEGYIVDLGDVYRAQFDLINVYERCIESKKLRDADRMSVIVA